MSWIFGFSGILNEQKKLGFSSIFPDPLVKIDEHRLFIAAGGNEFTCNFSLEKNWIVLGVGIETDNKSFRFLLKNDWEKKIEENLYKDLEGHFLLITWNKEKINFYNDSVGLRTIYFHKDKTGIYFSSNLDWITSVMSKTKIDFKVFGSRWMTFNQFSHNSFIYDVERLPPASNGEIKSGILNIQSENWFPDLNNSTPEELFSLLRNFLSIELPENLRMSFGLSGGLDSRFLLSFLLLSKNQKFNIHSFGYNDDADLQTAKKISDDLKLNCFLLHPEKMDNGQFLNKAAQYVASTQLAVPFSLYMKLLVLNKNYFEDKFLIDGAFAEFARRQFLNRLLLKGRDALIKNNYSGIIKHLLIPKPKIFKEEFEILMLENTAEQIKNIFGSFPDPKEIGFENFVDLLVVKYRLPNYLGPEQTRLDNFLPGFVPFVQKSIISASLGIPVKQRKNSRLFYKAIHENYPALENFPLVKNSIIHPYGLSLLTSHAFISLKRIFRRNNPEEKLFNFLRTEEKSIRKYFTRDEIREYKPYDEESVMQIINDFYEGKNKSTDDLNWLLTFEMFRKKLNIMDA